jgi:hypothetical protein
VLQDGSYPKLLFQQNPNTPVIKYRYLTVLTLSSIFKGCYSRHGLLKNQTPWLLVCK